MEHQELRTAVTSVLKSIAPEVNENELVANEALRDQVDLDSMDWLNFLVGLHRKLQVDIPESDYSRLRTLDDLVEYLHAKVR